MNEITQILGQYSGLTLAIVFSFVIALLLGPVIIPILRKVKAGQSIREEGPKSHQVKSGTPTMGGFIMIIAIVITSLTAGRTNTDMMILIMSLLIFSAIGFIDDFIKVVLKRNLGLRAWQKFTLQVVTAAGIAVYQAKISSYGTSLYVPFWDNYLNLGIFYVPFIVFVVVAMSNSVNLTDGLDGLAAGVSLFVALFFGIVAVNLGFGSVSVFSGAVVGACLGFLRYNFKPAKIFMGDMGALGLGGALAAAAILTNMTLLLPIVGAVFVCETLSVILQVASFKTRRKRIFKMSPLHHHFELSGWPEVRIVLTFWGITLLVCLIMAAVIL